MNDEMERSSLDLEDIIKEFSDHSQEAEQTPEETVAEEGIEEVAEEVAEENVEQTRRIDLEEIHKTQSEGSLEQTRRIDPQEIHKARHDADWAQQTRRIDPADLRKKAEDAFGATITFEAVRGQLSDMMEESESEDVAKIWNPGETAQTEAFTERWEPEYEHPMGEYVPPQPIQFQPRSRLHELKKKLVKIPQSPE